jgi:hypothetical protein
LEVKSEGVGDARFFLPDLLVEMRPGQADGLSTSAHTGQQIRRYDPEELANLLSYLLEQKHVKVILPDLK